MSALFIVNTQMSSRTAKYWRRNERLILSQFPGSTVVTPDTSMKEMSKLFSEFEMILLVGDDVFFSRAINSHYRQFIENKGRNLFAFLCDKADSAMASGLGLPTRLQDNLDLIKTRNGTPMNLVRCHFINSHGVPDNALILNDALIRLPGYKIPLVAKAMVQWVKTRSGFFGPQGPNRVILQKTNEKLYEGNYVFSILLLGNRITSGPKIRSKIRVGQTRFEYFQLNSSSFTGYTSSLPKLFTLGPKVSADHIFHGRFTELEVNSFGPENQIIADGYYLGRLPATFTLLSQAIRVITPHQLTKSPQMLKTGVPSGNLGETMSSRSRITPSKN